MIKILFSFLSFLLLVQTQAQPAEQKIGDLLSAYAAQHRFNGAVLVAQKGKLIYQNGFGYRNAEAKIPNDVNSIFQIGSITKQITAAVIMQLQQEGKLSVQDKLSQYFPGFANGDR